MRIKNYTAPFAEVLKVELAGIVCASLVLPSYDHEEYNPWTPVEEE